VLVSVNARIVATGSRSDSFDRRETFHPDEKRTAVAVFAELALICFYQADEKKVFTRLRLVGAEFQDAALSRTVPRL
jgi:hypothetical protein